MHYQVVIEAEYNLRSGIADFFAVISLVESGGSVPIFQYNYIFLIGLWFENPTAIELNYV